MQKPFHHYCLAQLLAQQRFKSTYLAYPQEDMDFKVVLKIFDSECLISNQEDGRNLPETKSYLSLDHPHIVSILDMGVVNQQPYIITQYMPHKSLQQRLADWSPTWTEAISIVAQLAEALIYAHERDIIHNNIKLSNIFFDDEGKVLLADFPPYHFIDIAKLNYKTDLQTTSYMSPEQFIGKNTTYSDQYALACLAYELITGREPFWGTQNFFLMWRKHTTEQPLPPTVLVPELPAAIDAILFKAMSKLPEMRYPDIKTFVSALESEMLLATTHKEIGANNLELELSLASAPHKDMSTAKISALKNFHLVPIIEQENIVSQLMKDGIAGEDSESDTPIYQFSKEKLPFHKKSKKPLVITLPTSLNQLYQAAGIGQQLQHAWQATLSDFFPTLRKRRIRRSKKFVVWTLALSIMVVLCLGSFLYSVNTIPGPNVLKNVNTLQGNRVSTRQAIAHVLATPKATSGPSTRPATAVPTAAIVAATTKISSNSSTINKVPTSTSVNVSTPGPPRNLALGVLEGASSSIEAYGWSLKEVNDGQNTSIANSMGWSSTCNYTNNRTEWLLLDLGSVVSISKVNMYPRSDAGNVGEGFPIDFSIALSQYNGPWTTVVSQSNYPMPSSGTVQTFSFAPQMARYVEIVGTILRPIPSIFNESCIQLAEVSVY